MAVACEYENCDDHVELRNGPAFKMACERFPDTGQVLNPMRWPPSLTLSWLDNSPSWHQLARMGSDLIDLFCNSLRAVPAFIVLGIDDTTGRTHGVQQLSFFTIHAGFNTHDDGYCFQPTHIYDAASQKLVCFTLRPGKRPSGQDAALVLRHETRLGGWSKTQSTAFLPNPLRAKKLVKGTQSNYPR